MTDIHTPWHLRGNYAPVMDELTEFDLAVTGAIPPGLIGQYLRNGSNPKSGSSGHWFFGDGMIHGVRLEAGRASWYRNRWVRTTKFDQDLDSMSGTAMMDPTASAANTHVLAHAGRIWALEEGHLPYEISPELDTIGVDNFDGRLTTAFTAHPKLCPRTGELHFFGYGAAEPHLTYHVLDASGQLVHSAPITVGGPTMMHDFMITAEHAIFMDLPVVIDIESVMRGGAPIHWDDNYGARIGILPRFGTDADVTWFEVDPCYVFHPLNAFADGSSVVCDVGRHEYMWRTSMNDSVPSYLHRWTFDLATGAVGEQQLQEIPHAFPRVDERLVGLRHRYGWAVEPRTAGDDLLGEPGVVVRYDLTTGSRAVFDLGADAYPGEFVFVPAEDTSGEDEGWAMGLVHHTSTDRTDLVILDASNPSADPVARVHLPRRVPVGFHGSWVSDAALGR